MDDLQEVQKIQCGDNICGPQVPERIQRESLSDAICLEFFGFMYRASSFDQLGISVRVEKTVFISYRRTDASWALLFYHALTQQGYDVFFDYKGLPSGSFEQGILENIRSRAHFLVVLTPSALDRSDEPDDWLRREIEEAIDYDRNIVPLMLGSFNFGAPAVAEKLIGKLAALKNYNGLGVSVEFFDAAMTKLREQFLDVSLDAVLRPVSETARDTVIAQKAAADAAPEVSIAELTVQDCQPTLYKALDEAQLGVIIPQSNYRFSVAISFAGDNKRNRVRQVAEILRDEIGEGCVFFDEWFEAEIAGQDASTVLQNIYQKSSQLVVTCVCKRYNEKPWTQDEWRAIQSFERTLRDAGTTNIKRMRFLPLRFGDGEIDGLFDTALVPDVRQRNPKQIAELILQRLKLSGENVENSDPGALTIQPKPLPEPSPDVKRPQIEDDEIKQLKAIRSAVLLSNSDHELKRSKFNLQNHLVQYPNSFDAQMLLEHVDKALSVELEYKVQEVPCTSAQPSTDIHWWRRHSIWLSVAIGVIVAVPFLPIVSDSPNSPAPEPLELSDFVLPDMVVIPEGTFMMGSETGGPDELPVQNVSVPSFELARNELSWAEWQLCEEAGDCKKIERPDFFSKIDLTEQPHHPVVNVNIASVNEYLTWLNKISGLAYRLPSEAEWEYAARAGSTTNFFWDDSIGKNNANCKNCRSQWDFESTAPVGSFDENPFGLNDVHGNVSEWTADCWHDNYEGAPKDGSTWIVNCTQSNQSPLRGGSWENDSNRLRSAFRTGYYAGFADFYIGFRLARTLP